MCRLCCEIKESRIGQRGIHRIQIDMSMELDLGPVVESGTLQGAVVHLKACNSYDMQRREGRGAEPSDIARIRRDLRFIQCDMKHLSATFEHPLRRQIHHLT